MEPWLKWLIATACVAVIAGAGLLFWQDQHRRAAQRAYVEAVTAQAAARAEDDAFRDECEDHLGLSYNAWEALRTRCINAGILTHNQVWEAYERSH